MLLKKNQNPKLVTFESQDHSLETIAKYVKSNDWWTVVDLSCTSIINKIERTYYADDSNLGFHVLLFQPHFMVIFMHKAHMDDKQFAYLFTEFGTEVTVAGQVSEASAEAINGLVEKEVIFLGATPEHQQMSQWFMSILNPYLRPN